MKNIVKQDREKNDSCFSAKNLNNVKNIVQGNFSNQTDTISVEQLASIIKAKEGNVTPESLREMMSNLVLSPESMAFVPKAGTNRSYTHSSFIRTSEVEFIFCKWLRGQLSDNHSHKGDLAAVKVLSGKLTSDKFGIQKYKNCSVISHGIKSETLAANDVSIIDVNEAHQLVCEQDAISLHVYIRPLIYITQYDPFSGKGGDRIFRCRV